MAKLGHTCSRNKPLASGDHRNARVARTWRCIFRQGHHQRPAVGGARPRRRDFTYVDDVGAVELLIGKPRIQADPLRPAPIWIRREASRHGAFTTSATSRQLNVPLFEHKLGRKADFSPPLLVSLALSI